MGSSLSLSPTRTKVERPTLTRQTRYISDIGARGLKPLFVAGSVITVVFLDLSFIAERWLRHAGQLVSNKGVFDKTCACLSIFFSIAGALGLILLSIFDTWRHSRLHEGFLVMFLCVFTHLSVPPGLPNGDLGSDI